MKILKGLCAAAITIIPAATTSAADLLPAMTDATDGGATVNSYAPQGYAERARLMIADENYRGAVDQLRRDLLLTATENNTPQREAAEYYLAVASAHVPGEDAAGLFSTFLEKYPASLYRERALLGLAGVLYDQRNFIGALEIYRSINPDSLNPSDAEEKTLNEAYCLLQYARYDEAKALYTSLLTTPQANSSQFYLAYIDYIKGNYPAALEGFKKVNIDDTDPAKRTPYYLAQLYYRNGDYKQALTQSRQLLSGNCPTEYKAETERIAGESLYELGKENEAIPLLNSYLSATDNPQPSALYILGVNAYNNGNYQKAQNLLTPVVNQENAMGQSAYLYMGQSFMQQGNYDSALLALDQAVKKDYNETTTELASYNYAVASARGGKVPFGSSVAQFENFLQRYPDSPMASSVADYVINGYISDNNYGAALTAINNIKNPSDKILAAKQKVLLMHGARQLQAGRTDDAISNLTEARSLGRYSGEIASESSLWLGEALYKKGNYSEAIKNYKNFLNETPSSNSNHSLALYDMAYAQFAQKDFTQSKDYFNRYLKSLNSSTSADVTGLKADAYNRIGDCYYYASDFTTAESNYEKAITEAPNAADYPMYQKALMKGLMRNHQGKIDGLATMMERFPSSALIPSALLETGESYTELNRNDKAISTYAILANRYPSTSQGRQGALLLAIAQLNSGSTDKAITSYKHVISTYPTSDEARAAADDLKHIYADRGEISEYTRFLASVPDAPKLEQSEIAALQLEGVEKAHEAGRDVDAARQAEELIASYPDSPQAVDALAILAETREKQGKPAEALAAYRQLAEKSSNEIDVNNARMGILRLSRDLGSDEAVLETASQLLESSSLGSDDRNEVMLAKALALRNTGKQTEANKILTTLAENPSTLPGAKASYYLAQGMYDNNNLSGALKQVNSLIDSNTPHEYWMARGFILLSDIKRRQGDTFEANEYLRSLRDNYPGDEADIFQMISSRLSN